MNIPSTAVLTDINGVEYFVKPSIVYEVYPKVDCGSTDLPGEIPSEPFLEDIFSGISDTLADSYPFPFGINYVDFLNGGKPAVVAGLSDFDE